MPRNSFVLSSPRHLQARPWPSAAIRTLFARSTSERETPRLRGSAVSHSRPFPLAIRALVTALTLVVLAGARGLAHDVTGTFVTIEVPGATFTSAQAITADGRIVGFFTDGNGRTHGFLLADGSFTRIDVPVPGARSTSALGINSRGDIVGAWVDSAGVVHGYLLPAYGSFTVVGFEDAILTTAFGINAAGDIVGQYDTREKRNGYRLSRAGVFTSIDLPGTQGPSPFGTSAFSINNRGDIVGSYSTGGFANIHGYLLPRGAMTHTQLDVPGGTRTQAFGINSQRDIVGNYLLGNRPVAFRRDRHGNYHSFEAPTATPPTATAAFGINAAGDIVGRYIYLGVTRGFVIYRTPPDDDDDDDEAAAARQ